MKKSGAGEPVQGYWWLHESVRICCHAQACPILLVQEGVKLEPLQPTSRKREL